MAQTISNFFKWCSCAIIVGINLVSAASSASTLEGRISLSGSSTIAPVILEIAKRFEDLHDNVRIDVESGGTQRGINELMLGKIDIAMVSRSLTLTEQNDAHLAPHVIARDGLCLILHKNNPIAEINRPDLLSIYRGNITNWNEVGGADMPITVINKAGGRATLDVFLSETKLEVSEIAAHVIVGENLQAIKVLSNNLGGIAYVSIGAAVLSEDTGMPIKRVSMGAVAPTVEFVSTGKYQPLRPLLLVTKSEVVLSTLEQAFLDFSQSEVVYDLIVEHGYAPAK